MKTKEKKHKHVWYFVEKWGGFSICTGVWLKTTYKFVCDCGKIKIVTEKL